MTYIPRSSWLLDTLMLYDSPFKSLDCFEELEIRRRWLALTSVTSWNWDQSSILLIQIKVNLNNRRNWTILDLDPFR